VYLGGFIIIITYCHCTLIDRRSVHERLCVPYTRMDVTLVSCFFLLILYQLLIYFSFLNSIYIIRNRMSFDKRQIGP